MGTRPGCGSGPRVLGGGIVGTPPWGQWPSCPGWRLSGDPPRWWQWSLVSLVAVEWAPAPVVVVALVFLLAVEWAPAPVVLVTLVSLVVVDPFKKRQSLNTFNIYS